MITHEECKTAQEHAQANLDQVKQIEATIKRRPQPIYSESGKVIGHRLVKVGAKSPKSEDVLKKEQKPSEVPEINSKNDTDMKTCIKCGKKKPVEDFNKMTKAKDGLQSWCKQCKNPVGREANNAKRDDITSVSCKHDEGKLRYDLCPAEWSEALAEVMTSGLVKYQPNSWRGGELCSFEAALMRHLIAWRKGETQDPDSGLNHLKHVMANAAILLSITDK